jgi:hypothetical protein
MGTPRKEIAVLSRKEVAWHVEAATRELNDSIHTHLTPAMQAAMSSMPEGMPYANAATLTAKAVDPSLKHSDADIIGSWPIQGQAMLALLRRGYAQRIPMWFQEAVEAGAVKAYKVPHARARTWLKTEAAALRALSFEDLVERLRQ